MSKIYLALPGEFDFALTCQFLQRSPRELLHRVSDGTVTKLLRVVDEKTLFSVRGDREKLIIQFLNGNPTSRARREVKNFVTEWFDLTTDLKPFYGMAAGDKLLGQLVKRFYGYRIVGQPDLFESLVWAVLGQQINLQFAYTLKQRFVEHFGERLFWRNESHYLFPDAGLVAGLKEEMLLPLQFSRQKSLYTITIAEAFASGAMSREKLKNHSLAEAKEQLMKIKGIGNWTANYALMKTFRYPDAFPLEDAGLHNAIRKLKKMDRKPTIEEVKKLFRRYRGWEAYATLYLWKSFSQD